MSKHNGFTLMEMIIILAIISILFTITYPSLVSTRNDTRETERARQEYVVNKALQQYYALTGGYPNPGHDSSKRDLSPDEMTALVDALQNQTGVNMDLSHYKYTYKDTNGDGVYETNALRAEKR